MIGLLAVLGGPEVEVAGHAQQLVRPDGRAGAAPAVGDVGLDRAEVAAAVEDDGQLLAEREAGHTQGDRGGGLLVQEGPPQEIVGVLAVVHVPWVIDIFTANRRLQHRPIDWAGSTTGRVRRQWG